MNRIAGFTILTACFLTACGGSSTGSVLPGVTGGSSGGTTSGDNGGPLPPAVCTTTSKVDVNVTVTTKKGPFGAAATRTISNNMWSMNIDDQVRDDYYPTPNATFVAYLKALHPQLLRWPAGYYGQHYTFSTTAAEGPQNMTPALIDSFVTMAKQAGAQPYLAVNLGAGNGSTGTSANAAAFVNYVNVTKKYGVKWWQLGNEPDINYYVPAQNETPQAYSTLFEQFGSAMKAVDPTIKLAGAEIMTGADVASAGGFGTCGQVSTNNCDWLSPILAETTSSPMDAIVFHYYPIDSSQTSSTSGAYPSAQHLLQEDASDWAPAGLDFASKALPAIQALKAKYAPNAQIWVDEFAEDSGQANGMGLSDRVVGDLWAADALGRFAEYGTDATFHFIFKGDDTHGYALLDTNNIPRPEYYTYWLYANQFGDTLVDSTTDAIASVSPHASLLAADGSLHVMLVNKETVAQNVRVKLPDFTPRVATQYVLQGASQLATTVTLNGQTFTPANIVNGANAIAATAAQACTDNIVTIPANSVMMLVFTAQK